MLRFFLCLASLAIASGAKLDVAYEWKYFDFLWPNEEQRAAAISSGDYNYTASTIIDVDKAQDGRVFATIIRAEGVPASLTTITGKSGNGGPLLAPYPDWSWAKKGNCNAITSVYRVAIDRCNRLWVLDTGRIGDDQVCEAQLLAFDLATDRLLKRVKIPNSISQSPKLNRGLLVTPIVETHGRRCEEVYVYMADVDGYGLVIYNGREVWRLDSAIFGPNSKAENFTIQGESFVLADGVLGMAQSRDALYFHSLASYDMNAVSTNSLKKSRNGVENIRYFKARNFLPSQAPAQAFSENGNLFFVLTKETALSCWNRFSPAERKNIVQLVRDPKILQFASGVKVIPSRPRSRREELWMVTNRFQKIMAGTMNFNEVNFRILRGSVDELVANTGCQSQGRWP